jgi:hypothetical protein
MDPDADSGEAQKHTNPDAAPDREHCLKQYLDRRIKCLWVLFKNSKFSIICSCAIGSSKNHT